MTIGRLNRRYHLVNRLKNLISIRTSSSSSSAAASASNKAVNAEEITQSPKIPHLYNQFPKGVKVSPLDTPFDIMYKGLTEHERLQLEADYMPLNESDWRYLTLDQKRALYTIAYGPPFYTDPYESWKIAGGVTAGILIAGVVFYIARSMAQPPPKTFSPEWKEAERKRMIEERINPIFGITAKEDAKKKALQLNAAEKESIRQSKNEVGDEMTSEESVNESRSKDEHKSNDADNEE